MTTEDLDWTELAAKTKARRAAMRLPQDLIDRGGPSEITVRKIERGDPGPYRPKTLTQLEHALNWPDGLTRRILDGTATEEDLAATVLRDTPGSAMWFHSVGSGKSVTLANMIARGEIHSRSVTDSAPATDSVTAGVTRAKHLSGDPVDLFVMQVRDTAIRGLLDYAAVLDTPDTAEMRSLVVAFARRLMDLPGDPAAGSGGFLRAAAEATRAATVSDDS